MGEDLFEDAPCCAPDPELDGWDPDWDRDWEPPHRWADDDAEELVGAAVGGAAGAPVSGAAGGAVVGAAAAGGAVAVADAGTVGGAGPDAARWIPARGWTGEGEVFAAGFLHRDRWDDVPAGAGFAAGGFMDDLAAGPLLATLISEATAPTLSAHTAATTATRTTGSAHPAAGSASADPVATADSTAATTGRTLANSHRGCGSHWPGCGRRVLCGIGRI